ncbi:Bifunctional polymyxin resistance protein ArnA [Lacunisphaera limnophila]|uniref:Bifunctional polymyxin resistance protein ArnA n=1 Tax=Lacunisphaera limnophila TaxID=1838286 RepID=A0A1D8AVS5_9BACT|nr:methionyl-tRNA formyltransferase [Lacunisphaera limnophila]AOS45000.1 Bifunctional polymyxin resistance protein ArnA [Lacunisphaera limnophila]
MKPIRVGFAGCHVLSWFCLRTVAELCRGSGDTLAGVFNLPPEVGQKHSAYVEFDALEREYGFPHHRVRDLAEPPTLQVLRELNLDVLFIIGWHKIVPQEVIDSARFCLGMHTSLLPADRGSSPVNWALIRGDRRGGITFFHLTTGVDSGDVLAQRGFRIHRRDTCREVHQRATTAAIRMLRAEWPLIRAGVPPRLPQNEALATYNPRRRAADGLINWQAPAEEIDRWVRALTSPYPGAFTHFRGRKLFIWEAKPAKGATAQAPGTIVRVGETIHVATGRGLLELKRLQFEGEPESPAHLFAAVHSPEPGSRLA